MSLNVIALYLFTVVVIFYIMRTKFRCKLNRVRYFNYDRNTVLIVSSKEYSLYTKLAEHFDGRCSEKTYWKTNWQDVALEHAQNYLR